MLKLKRALLVIRNAAAYLIKLVINIPSLVVHVIKRFYRDNCLSIASALTYTALLAVVPLFTITFGILSVFPAFENLQEEAKVIIFTNMVPSVGDAMQQYLDKFVHNAANLTSIGTAVLVVTSIMLLFTIEGAFNRIWRVSEPRPILTRLLAFWAILTLTPLLFGLSLSLSGTASKILLSMNIEPVAAGLIQSKYLPFVVEAVIFALLYTVIPNRDVGRKDAVIGGVIAAAMLEASKYGFAMYTKAFPAYETVYGALSLIPIFLLWFYITWAILLLGAVITSSIPEWESGQLVETDAEGVAPSQYIAIALAVIAELHAAMLLGVGLRRRALLKRIPVGGAILDDVTEKLHKKNWINRTDRDTWILGRDASAVTLHDLTKALGLGLRGNIKGIARLNAVWQDDLMQMLEKTEQGNIDCLSVSIKNFLSKDRGSSKKND